MTAQINLNKRKSISKGLAVTAITLLTIDTVNTFPHRKVKMDSYIYLIDKAEYTLVCLLYFYSFYHLGLDLDKKQE